MVREARRIGVPFEYPDIDISYIQKLGREHRCEFSVRAPWIDIGVCGDNLVEPAVSGSVRESAQGESISSRAAPTVHVVYITAPQPSANAKLFLHYQDRLECRRAGAASTPPRDLRCLWREESSEWCWRDLVQGRRQTMQCGK